jgi:DnaK suppressor protein
VAKPKAKKLSKGKAATPQAKTKASPPRKTAAKPGPKSASKPSAKHAKSAAKPPGKAAPIALAKDTAPKNGVAAKKTSAKAAAPIKTNNSAKLQRPVHGSGNGRDKRDKQAARSVNAPLPAPMPMVEIKPAKNLAGLKARDLEFFRELLLGKRRELVGDMHSMEAEALRSTSGSNLSNLPMHMADMGTDNYEQEFTLGLVEKDRQLLREINLALKKLAEGTYGICEGTGKPITRARLEAKPWARYSIEYTIKLEKGLIRG